MMLSTNHSRMNQYANKDTPHEILIEAGEPLINYQNSNNTLKVGSLIILDYVSHLMTDKMRVNALVRLSNQEEIL